MNYQAIMDAIYTQLSVVTGIGKTYQGVQYAETWDEYISNFMVNDVVNAAWVSRTVSAEKPTSTEAALAVIVDRGETWRISLVYSYNLANNTEKTFQELVDKIQAKFRFAGNLGLSVISRTYPIDVLASGLSMFGEVLCHRADMELRLEQSTYKTT